MTYLRLLHIALLVLLFCSTSVFGQGHISFEQLNTAMKVKPRPIVFFFHTDWCNYCAIQVKQLKKDADIQKLLNEHFYFVDFDTESDKKILFNGKHYGNVQRKYATHDLVKSFFSDERGSIGFPAWVITDKNYQVIFRHQGLLKPKKLKEILGLAVRE